MNRLASPCGLARGAAALWLGVAALWPAAASAQTAAPVTATVPAAARPAPLLTFQRVLDRPDRPQPQQRIAYGTEPQQFGELWLPPAERFGAGPHPVVLLVHGGCWMAELPGPQLLAWQAEALRQQGLAVWSISYRRVGHAGGGYPGTFQDVARGADHLRELARSHPLDLGRVTASGHSAGGHLALWLAARPRLPAASPLHSEAPLPVQRVVPVAGVGDLAWAAPFIGAVCSPDIAGRLVDEKARGTAAWADTSPAALAPLGVPVTMVSGVYDAIVPPAHGRRFAQVAGARGEAAVTLLNLDEAGHFELIAPWTPAGAATVRAIAGR
jgi:acetyl esterase/lipase